MKTPVTLVSPDRDLFGNRIRHITKPNLLCLTDLQRIYEEVRIERGWTERNVREILNHKKSPINTERLYFVLKQRGLINVEISTFIEDCDNKTLIKVLKEMKLYATKGRGNNRLTYCLPDIFVLVALELNPEFYGKTVVWLTDSLVVRRIYAGDNNNLLKNRIFLKWGVLSSNYYQTLNKGLNYYIFNTHFKDIRNTGTEEQLRDLELIQSNLAFLVENDYIMNKEDLINKIRQMYSDKFRKKII